VIVIREVEKGKTKEKEKKDMKQDEKKQDEKREKGKDEKREKGKDEKREKGKDEKREKEKEPKEAKLVVELPADARLFIDGMEMKSGTVKRGIVTPPLDPGQTYHYQVKAVLVRNGFNISETQTVRLIPGELVTTRFTNLESRAAAIVRANER
jgi:uncharacterized protein (TIGR03000 family)